MSFHDISRMTSPQAAVTTIKRATQYIAHMESTGKPVDHVSITPADYDQILRSVNSVRKKTGHDPASSLLIGSVKVVRGRAAA